MSKNDRRFAPSQSPPVASAPPVSVPTEATGVPLQVVPELGSDVPEKGIETPAPESQSVDSVPEVAVKVEAPKEQDVDVLAWAQANDKTFSSRVLALANKIYAEAHPISVTKTVRHCACCGELLTNPAAGHMIGAFVESRCPKCGSGSYRETVQYVE